MTSTYTNPRTDVLNFLKLNERHMPLYGSLLDIGCGSGLFGSSVLAHGLVSVVDGVEVDGEAMLLAKHRRHRHVFLRFLGREPLPFGKYDLVTALDVLEHLENPEKLLLEIHDSLCPSSCLVLSVPNVSNWRVLWSLLVDRNWPLDERGIFDKTHLRWFTRRSLLRLLDSTGYDVLALSHTGGRRGLVHVLDILSFGLIRDFLAIQWLVICRRRLCHRSDYRKK